MKRLLSMLLLASITISACHAEQPMPSASDVYGTWKVTKINTTGVVTQGDERINGLVGTILTIDKDKVLEAGEEPCRIVKPYPIVSVVNTADEVPAKAAPSPAAAGLPMKATMVDTGCLAVFKVEDHIVFADRGAYYTAERVVVAR